MNKTLPKERKISGLEQVQILLQTAEREKEIHRLEHELNASKINYKSAYLDWLDECEKNNHLQAEIDIHHQQLNSNLAFMEESNQIIMRQQAEINKFRKALEFYADAENHKHIPLFKTAHVLIDKGDYARYVLGGRSDA